RHICNWNYKDKNIVLEQGMEMGRFNMGSTVILLFPPKSMAWQNLAPGKNVQMGQIIGEIQKT
ncbi:MAG: phosphatidylserine decarboxylase, partial [Gammaproteobacteria bacterium]|nr:phosphatidylserine decarboxylase [Gammaproteobacteria bacterium]